jgi:AmmeMemoRadiSam system protein A
VPSPSAEPVLEPADLDLLFDMADASIANGLQGRTPRLPDVATLPEPLRRRQHAFVTLTVDGALNGCIGDIEGDEPLARAVAHHAWAAAFTDPRLPPLRPEEYERLLVEISLLSDMVPVAAASRHELLAVLRRHVDGLVVSALGRRALFLPAVWEQLPRPAEFLDHLLVKAGLAPGSWPVGMTTHTFTAARFARKAGARSSSAA